MARGSWAWLGNSERRPGKAGFGPRLACLSLFATADGNGARRAGRKNHERACLDGGPDRSKKPGRKHGGMLSQVRARIIHRVDRQACNLKGASAGLVAILRCAIQTGAVIALARLRQATRARCVGASTRHSPGVTMMGPARDHPLAVKQGTLPD
jgi:hypothetical protein